MADRDVEELAEIIAGMPVAFAANADWRDFYGAMRDMVNETAMTAPMTNATS